MGFSVPKCLDGTDGMTGLLDGTSCRTFQHEHLYWSLFLLRMKNSLSVLRLIDYRFCKDLCWLVSPSTSARRDGFCHSLPLWALFAFWMLSMFCPPAWRHKDLFSIWVMWALQSQKCQQQTVMVWVSVGEWANQWKIHRGGGSQEKSIEEVSKDTLISSSGLGKSQ